jgi:hypothetical protein
MCSVRLIAAAIVPLLVGMPGPAAYAQASPDALPSAALPIASQLASTLVSPPDASLLSPLAPLASSFASPVALRTTSPMTPRAALPPVSFADALNKPANPLNPSETSLESSLEPSNGIGLALSATALDGLRGGSELVFNDMQLNGTVADTRATQVITGNNTITEGSFANASGLPTVIQNSGANVLIQNATIVNVQFRQ